MRRRNLEMIRINVRSRYPASSISSRVVVSTDFGSLLDYRTNEFDVMRTSFDRHSMDCSRCTVVSEGREGERLQRRTLILLVYPIPLQDVRRSVLRKGTKKSRSRDRSRHAPDRRTADNVPDRVC